MCTPRSSIIFLFVLVVVVSFSGIVDGKVPLPSLQNAHPKHSRLDSFHTQTTSSNLNSRQLRHPSAPQGKTNDTLVLVIGIIAVLNVIASALCLWLFCFSKKELSIADLDTESRRSCPKESSRSRMRNGSSPFLSRVSPKCPTLERNSFSCLDVRYTSESEVSSTGPTILIKNEPTRKPSMAPRISPRGRANQPDKRGLDKFSSNSNSSESSSSQSPTTSNQNEILAKQAIMAELTNKILQDRQVGKL